MAEAIGIKLEGIKEFIKAANASEKDIINFGRAATHKVAGMVTKGAKKRAAKDTGLLKGSIKSKRRKARGAMFRSDTIILSDAWYWPSVEFGAKGRPAQPFVGPALRSVRPEAPSIYFNEVLKKTIKLMKKRAK